MNVFQQSRRQLTLYYSLIMAAFLVVLIFFVHQSMEWSMESEQARELVETAGRIAGGQEYLMQHPELMEDAEDWRQALLLRVRYLRRAGQFFPRFEPA